VLEQVAAARDADQLGRLLHEGGERVEYFLVRESQAVASVVRLGLEQAPGLSDLALFAAQQRQRLERAVKERAAQLGSDNIQPIADPVDPEASKIVVRRKRMGTITLDDLPHDRREGYPAASFSGPPVTALYWCDGKRNLAEVIRLTRLEIGPVKFDFKGYFKFLERHGYVEFVR